MGKMHDMMLIPGGKERAPSEYAELLEPDGFRLPTASAASVVEAVWA